MGTALRRICRWSVCVRHVQLRLIEREVALKNGIAKLRLRPLSDMTREEAIFYASLHRNMDGFVGNVGVKPGNNSDTHIKYFMGGWGMSLFVGGPSSTYKAAAFHYLLKQGFDLFGLIEAGLAIDKTKEVK